MGPAELTELQSFHEGIPPWVEHEVQSDFRSKDQHLAGSVR